jgi:hypothetical protein
MRGTWREGSLTGDLKDMLKRYIKIDVKMPCKQVSLSTGAPLGTRRRFACQDFLREKDSISGFLSWTQRALRFQTWGPSGTPVKGQGSPELISDYVAPRAHL